jgi:LEA14-like dessication related protein
MSKTANADSRAQVAMSNRTRVSFGPAYFRKLIAGTQRDVNKHASLAVKMGLLTASRVKRMPAKKLIEVLQTAVKETPVESLPKNAEFIRAH